MKALVRDNIVMDLAENEFVVHSDYVWVDNPPDGCKVGWILEEGEFIAPTPLVTAEELFKKRRNCRSLLSFRKYGIERRI